MTPADTIHYNVDYAGRVFDRFYPRKDSSTGPGWYVFGRNPDYGTLIKLCARPNVKPRWQANYSGPVREGWHTKREAEAIAKQLNS